MLIGGCISNKYDEKMKTTEKSVLMIIAHKNFRDEEFEEPYKIFTNAGIITTIASSNITEAKGMFGKTVKPNITISDVVVNNYDAIVFVGGSGASQYFNDETAINIAREAYKQRKVIGAICIAPVILANAGILQGKKATVWDGEFISKLKSGKAIYTGKDVEIDENIITANGPSAARKFGNAILNALTK